LLSEVRVLNISKKVTIASLAFILMAVIMAIGASAQEYSWNGPNDAVFWGLTGALCFIPLIAVIIGIVLAIWVYKDAEKRGSSGALWLIIVLITGIIGLIVWLVVRPPIGGKKEASEASSERRCPNCGRIIPDDARVCPYCSKKFDE